MHLKRKKELITYSYGFVDLIQIQSSLHSFGDVIRDGDIPTQITYEL